MTTVHITYTPTQAGEFGALVVLSCSDTGPGGTLFPRTYFLCQARAAAPPNCPTCSVSPSELDFGNVTVGSTKQLPVTVTNVGAGTLVGTLAENCPVFAASGSYRLGPGGSETFMVSFTLPSTASFTCSSIVPGANCPPVTAHGAGARPPSCALSRTSLDFGSVAVGQSKDLTFDLENSGDGTLCGTVTENCPDFTIETNDSYCITRPAFVRVTVRFTPTSAGLKQCTIAPGANCPPVTVTGSGS